MSGYRVKKSLKQNFIKVILTKKQERSQENKKGVRIRKSGYIESDRTYYCTEKFNVALSLDGVLEIALHFSENFSKVATETLQLLEVTVVYFLGQEWNLQSPMLQQRYKLCLRHFLCSSLVNLPFLKERFICRELDCFLGVENTSLKGDDLADEATGDISPLFWKSIALPTKEALPCFQK